MSEVSGLGTAAQALIRVSFALGVEDTSVAVKVFS